MTRFKNTLIVDVRERSFLGLNARTRLAEYVKDNYDLITSYVLIIAQSPPAFADMRARLTRGSGIDLPPEIRSEEDQEIGASLLAASSARNALKQHDHLAVVGSPKILGMVAYYAQRLQKKSQAECRITWVGFSTDIPDSAISTSGRDGGRVLKFMEAPDVEIQMVKLSAV